MPQNEHIELHQKRYGKRLDYDERKRKKQAREVHKRSAYAQKALGLKGKMFAKKRHQEKATMKKTIAMHEERDNKHKAQDGAPQNAVPAYLLEREQVRRGQVQWPVSFAYCKFIAMARGSGLLGNLRDGSLDSCRPPSRLAFAGGPRQGPEQHHQAEAEGEGGQVGGASAAGEKTVAGHVGSG